MNLSNPYLKLFEPGSIGRLHLRNRIIMAPMGVNLVGLDGRQTQRHIDYFAERARGGAGLIITGTHKVENRIESLSATRPRADADNLIASMSDLVETVHDCGARIAIQLTAGQGRESGNADPKSPPVSASAVPAFGNPSVICHPLSIDEIQTVVKAFGAAAVRAEVAGFDAIELHGHAGYLIDQFLSSNWNNRFDAYGGNLDKRMRFATEIVETIRKVVGPDFPVIFRFSVDQKIAGGRTIKEAQKIAQRLESAGVTAIHADAGCYESMEWIFPSNYLGTACMINMAEVVKQVVDIPVIAVGNMTPGAGEEVLASGKADFIAIGRGLIADPAWPGKLLQGRQQDIRPCIRCNDRCVGRLFKLKAVSCSVNARAGNEGRFQIERAETEKNVLVVGGGPAGLEAARVAAMRGYRVTLLEKEPVLGGMLAIAATPIFKKGLQQMVTWWKRQLDKLGVEVQCNVEVTLETPQLASAQVIVVATGGKGLQPPIPGINGQNVLEISEYHRGTKTVQGEQVVIAGGGLSGCDAGLELAMEGKTVTIVEMAPDVALDLNAVNRSSLLRLLAEHNVRVLVEHCVTEFHKSGLTVQGPEGTETIITADTMVVAFGVKPDNTLADAIQLKWPETYSIGDCIDPGKVGDAVRAGFAIGRRI